MISHDSPANHPCATGDPPGRAHHLCPAVHADGDAVEPPLLRSVLFAADGGNLARLADLCDSLLADDRIGAGMATRAASLFALPFELEGSDELWLMD